MPFGSRTVPIVTMATAVPPSAAVWAQVRTRRIAAACVDFMLLSLVCCVVLPLVAMVIAIPLGILFFAGSLALSWFVLPSFYPALAFFYNGYTESGRSMGTPGMRLMDLEVRLVDGRRVPFLNAAFHGLLFYVSWLLPPVFLLSLMTPDKSCLHDQLAQVRVMRRTH